jgi:hypothetical protein
MAMMKSFGLGREGARLTLRFEAQNLFNHMNAGQPTGDLKSVNFGVITAQSGSPRRAMIGAKISF